MCGIAGHVDFGKGSSLDATRDLVAGIRHRGPDDQGLWASHNGLCALGHARLSVIDLSPLGHQPMFDPETGNCIVFNGEVYNFDELRRQCEALGDHFRSQSDTEVILALYRRHGVDCLGYLRGMFALAIWDAQQERLFFARDRVGKKPLNYALTKRGIVFCSEIHPLSRHPEVSREMDTEALEMYLQVQAIPAPWTIYGQIRKLPPAHYAVFDRSGLTLKPYWAVNYLHTTEFSDDEALEAFEAKLTEAVKLRMISDVPLGALLSGGVDSSVVVALMAKLSSIPVSTFSIGFREEKFNELPYADQVARICQTDHHSKIVEGHVGDLLPLLARHYGEPFADSSAIPSFHVSRVARRHVTVVLNGDGGDELLGGYSRYAVSDLSIRSGTALSGVLGARRLVNGLPHWMRARSLPARAIRKIARSVVPEIGSLMLFGAHWNDLDRTRLMGSLHQPDLFSRLATSLV
jgi:asparagine synthase (glutamine-hydrolysing)